MDMTMDEFLFYHEVLGEMGADEKERESKRIERQDGLKLRMRRFYGDNG